MKTVWYIIGALVIFIAGLFTGHRYGSKLAEQVNKAKDGLTKGKDGEKPADKPKDK